MPKLRAPSKKRIFIRATHPNAGLTVWYQRALTAEINGAHQEVERIVRTALGNEAPRAVLASDFTVEGGVEFWVVIAADASPPGQLNKLLRAWANKWTVRFDKLSVVIAKKFASHNFSLTEMGMRAALKSAGFTVAFKPSKASLDAYKAVVAENVNLIKSIPAQYLTGVQSAVWTSVTRGSDLDTLSRTLGKQYGSTVDRAALIARDQNAKAKATIENTRRQQLGITHAIWQHSAGGVVPRPTHVAMNNKSFELSRGMYDTDVQAFVLPGQLINCRCTSRAIIEGIDE